MNITLCMVCMALAGGATGAEPAGEKPDTSGNDKVQAVIDQVDKVCRDGGVCMIGPMKAKRLAELVRRSKPRRVVECGTALGYSGLWIARELKTAGQGKLITIEINPQRAKQAEASFRKAGLEEFVTVKVGDARKAVTDIEGPIDFVFIDCGYSNYLPCLKGLQDKLSGGATIVADNVGIGAGGMKDYLEEVRSKYQSRTEWFELDLPWAGRDAMEVTIISDERKPFLDWPEGKSRPFGHLHPESAVADVPDITSVQPATYDEYLARRKKGEITVEMIRDGHVYFAVETRRDVPFPPTPGGPVSAWVYVTERYKVPLPPK